MNLPRQCLHSPAQQSHTCGGNLAPSNAPSTGGHSLFLAEKPAKFGAQITSGDRGLLPYPVKARAAHGGHSRITAQSLAPLTHVDHFTHFVLLPSLTVTGGHSRKQERRALQ